MYIGLPLEALKMRNHQGAYFTFGYRTDKFKKDAVACMMTEIVGLDYDDACEIYDELYDRDLGSGSDEISWTGSMINLIEEKIMELKNIIPSAPF